MKLSPIESQNNRLDKKSYASRGFTEGKREGDSFGNRTRPRVIVTPPLDMYTSTIFVGAVPSTIFGNNQQRRYLLIQNVGTVTAFIGFGSTPDALGNNGVELASGFQISFESGYCPNNDAKAITGSQTKLIVVEGVI